MENETITSINPPGALRRLLKHPSMRGMLIVSEVHSYSSYARLLCANGTSTLTLGLHVQTPVSGAASASTTRKWVRVGSSGNFKSQVNTKGDSTFWPLYGLSSLSGKGMSTEIGR
ncbi:hypothetical protein K438DRAFT_1992323 [Mycena galopus ATCC 62051]|nr:hypothetical protein K438DRAFT_1992323 [Mycena galopus ATCC 62051]